MIKKVLVIGLGGVGALYSSKIKSADVKVLLDENRLEHYINNPTIINNEEYEFDYITQEGEYTPDLIIISTKFNHLDDVLGKINSYIHDGVMILSLLNGVSSERIIAEKYPMAKVINSYVMCNSVIREGRKITHDNVNKIVIEDNNMLEEFLKQNNINYEISNDIKTSMWQKFMLNIIANQLSAVTRRTFGEMNSLPYINRLLNNILEEVVLIAEQEGVKDSKILAQNAIKTFNNMADYGKTSMLQDIENGSQTEVEAFAGEIISLGKKHNIETTYNNLFYYLLK